jgi:sugar-phosphatase
VADHILTRLELRDHFTTIITAEDVSRGKPDPEGYLPAAARLKVTISDCIVVEDSSQGVAAAKSAGARCIALTTTHSHAELKQANLIVDELTSELLA